MREEFTGIGFKIPIRMINDYTPEQTIIWREGIIFSTYKSLIARSKAGGRRLDQLTSWQGNEGILDFEEGHQAK